MGGLGAGHWAPRLGLLGVALCTPRGSLQVGAVGRRGGSLGLEVHREVHHATGCCWGVDCQLGRRTLGVGRLLNAGVWLLGCRTATGGRREQLVGLCTPGLGLQAARVGQETTQEGAEIQRGNSEGKMWGCLLVRTDTPVGSKRHGVAHPKKR